MKFKDLIYKLRHVVAIMVIVAVSMGCFAWIEENTVEEATDMWHRTIGCDIYTDITEPITNEIGVVQHIKIIPNTEVYGVNLNVHTFGRMCSGTMYVDIFDMEDNLLASSSADLSTVYNDNFKRFMFDKKIERITKSGDYKLHIYIDGDTEEDKVALWKDPAYTGWLQPVAENGIQLDSGAIAYQYITEYVNGEMAPYFKILSAIMLVFLVAAYIAVFVFKLKVHNVFLVLALGMGFIFSIFTPLRGAPDEYTHMGMSYYQSNQMLGIKDSYQDGQLLMRECDYGDTFYPASSTAFELKEIYEGLFKSDEGKTELIPVWTRWSEGYFPPLYWAQAMGITLARLLGMGRIQMYVMGRLGNLVMYTALIYFAIRKMPFFKTTMAAVALTPIALQLAASFTYDAFVISLCFLFTAIVFDLAYNKERVTVKDTVALTVLAALIAPGKAVYVAVVALGLIIPWKKFGSRKKYVLNIVFIVAVSASMWLAFNQNFISQVKESLFPQSAAEQQIAVAEAEYTEGTEAEPEIIVVDDGIVTETVSVEAATQAEPTPAPAPEDDLLENGDSRYLFSPGYILGHIPQTVKLIVNTIQDNTSLYIYQIFGGILGEVILSPVHINWLFVVAVMVIVYLTTVKKEDEILQYKGGRKWWATLVALAVVALFCTACITWTPVNYETVFGIQGRYFMPVLPLLIMALSNENITLKKNIDRILLFALAVVNILIILDGFTIIALNSEVLFYK